jgi:hypothetical protein
MPFLLLALVGAGVVALALSGKKSSTLGPVASPPGSPAAVPVNIDQGVPQVGVTAILNAVAREKDPNNLAAFAAALQSANYGAASQSLMARASQLQSGVTTSGMSVGAGCSKTPGSPGWVPYPGWQPASSGAFETAIRPDLVADYEMQVNCGTGGTPGYGSTPGYAITPDAFLQRVNDWNTNHAGPQRAIQRYVATKFTDPPVYDPVQVYMRTIHSTVLIVNDGPVIQPAAPPPPPPPPPPPRPVGTPSQWHPQPKLHPYQDPCSQQAALVQAGRTVEAARLGAACASFQGLLRRPLTYWYALYA